MGYFEWSAGFHLLVLGWICAPIYLHNNISTLPEYLERRFSPRLRTFLATVSVR